jgi:hypothetical protein
MILERSAADMTRDRSIVIKTPATKDRFLDRVSEDGNGHNWISNTGNSPAFDGYQSHLLRVSNMHR